MGPSSRGDMSQISELQSATQLPSPPITPENLKDIADLHIDDEDEDVSISVSTTFYHGSKPSMNSDLILLASDYVFFYVHLQRVLQASTNKFNGLVHSSSKRDAQGYVVAKVPETSHILNIILHTVYDMSCTHYQTPFPIVYNAVNLLETYGLMPSTYVAPKTPLFYHLASYAPVYPLDLYALAAYHDLYPLASACSAHLLSLDLINLSDDSAARIGPVYLKKLFALHLHRDEALKKALRTVPQLHPETPYCDFSEQRRVSTAWSLAAAAVAWNSKPDMSNATLEAAFRPLNEEISCALCIAAVNDRIKELLVEWSLVCRTI